jgi:hypothetical protein
MTRDCDSALNVMEFTLINPVSASGVNDWKKKINHKALRGDALPGLRYKSRQLYLMESSYYKRIIFI